MKISKWKKYKILSIIILVFLGIFILFTITEKSRAEKALEKNLYKRYGEEFNISALYKRKSNSGTRYQAEYIYPKSYDGTLKEYDIYYWGKGFVRVENLGLTLIAGDTYGGVLLNESANEFYLSKLKELFGENVLPVLDIRGAYEYTDFQKEYLREEKTISGGIYIFGRVENDEDREWYRKQIYEFVQFMKQIGTFEYVALTFEIIDERILSSDFSNVKSEFEKKVNIAKRRELLSNVNPPTSQEKKEKIENLIKSEMSDFSGKLLLLYTQIYSEKYIKSNSLDREIKSYDNYKDVDFTIQWY